MSMLDDVYADTVEEKSIVAMRHKPRPYTMISRILRKYSFEYAAGDEPDMVNIKVHLEVPSVITGKSQCRPD